VITRIEALNYRCLRYVAQDLGLFHVLVGPNASGKTSFVDVLAFLSRFMADGLDAAISERTSNFYDLVWGRQGSRFELAVEAVDSRERGFTDDSLVEYGIRYEVAFGVDAGTGATRVLGEQIYELALPESSVAERADGPPPVTLAGSGATRGGRGMVRNYGEGSAQYCVIPELPDEALLDEKSIDSYELVLPRHEKRSLLHALDEAQFPVATELRESLERSVSKVDLAGVRLRQPTPPGRGHAFAGDGSNVPALIERLQSKDLQRYGWWLAHLRSALPDLEGLRVVDRPEDRHRYLMLQYANGLEVPSWMASEGTLRFIALTLLAYSNDAPRLCIVEEPENSIHPLNIELVMQSLQSGPDRQVLVTTHSPTVLSCAKAEDVLVFARDSERGVRIVRGDQHAGLADWKGSPDLSVLYASGVFG
jgi:predicted ATPase